MHAIWSCRRKGAAFLVVERRFVILGSLCRRRARECESPGAAGVARPQAQPAVLKKLARVRIWRRRNDLVVLVRLVERRLRLVPAARYAPPMVLRALSEKFGG